MAFSLEKSRACGRKRLATDFTAADKSPKLILLNDVIMNIYALLIYF